MKYIESRYKHDSLHDFLFTKAKEGNVSNKGRFAAFMRNCIDVHENPHESLGVGGGGGGVEGR